MQVGKQIKVYEDGYKGPKVLTQAQQNKLLAIRPTPKPIDNRLMYMDDEDNTDEQDDDVDDEEETIPKVKPKVINKNTKQNCYKDRPYILLVGTYFQRDIVVRVSYNILLNSKNLLDSLNLEDPQLKKSITELFNYETINVELYHQTPKSCLHFIVIAQRQQLAACNDT
ncbi:MAG: hypothetical protein EZS28_013892 [Streblomastix strix]|uniref:Uncharacterized protein n=1 Tax=Streblomastix strix TaxID=222440 RepID=A0A5J4W6T9_9EUKA|nr:MAG: hypothetical protein EZS28_013892 [Streblomastix strix]